MIETDQLDEELRQEAIQHLANHYKNVDDDRRDYSVRIETSLNSNDLLSYAEDAAAKHLNKYPRLNVNRGKKLSDAMKEMCTLTARVVHKKCRQFT